MTAKSIVDIVRPYLTIAFGLLIFSIAWTAFLLPHQISGSGVTVIDGVGWYSRENQKVLVTLVRKQEASDVYRIIKEIDRDAFITVANVMGVYGKGFEEIKE